jgi:hypothetical protein
MITTTSAPQFYPTKPARTQLRVVQREQAPLTTAEKERIVAEQRAANAWAIKQSHREGGLRFYVASVLRDLDRRHHEDLAAAIKYAGGDAAALQAALIALADIVLLVTVLIDAGAVTDVAADAFDERLAIIHAALVRFVP